MSATPWISFTPIYTIHGFEATRAPKRPSLFYRDQGGSVIYPERGHHDVLYTLLSSVDTQNEKQN